MKVLESSKVVAYLHKRNLVAKYKKAKQFLQSDKLQAVDFKKRKPKSAGVYYFKIDKKYRAIGYFEVTTFIVSEISDHQDG